MEKNLLKNTKLSLSFYESEHAKENLLKKIFPQLFLNDQIDINILYELLMKQKALSDYHLNWCRRDEILAGINLFPKKTLQQETGKGIEENQAQHFFIEGDNLEVLKILRHSYAGKIKIIYIDPPYNTGQFFIYNDNYYSKKKEKLFSKNKSEEKNSLTNEFSNDSIHGEWLSMMYPRLLLAKEFLTEDGIIFISIDDNEVHNLRVMLDEIFGCKHFCGAIKRRAARKNTFLSKCMTDLFDYILIYSKSAKLPFFGIERDFEKTRPVFNEGNKLTVRIIPEGCPANCPDGIFKAGIYKNRSLYYEAMDDIIIKNGILSKSVKIKAPWRVNQDIVDKTIFITKKLGFRRHVLADELKKRSVLSDFLDSPDCYNEKGTEELKVLFNAQKKIFTNPKPTGLIEYIIKSVKLAPNDYIMDFFAGSGTTLHAVLKLNALENYQLNSISIQNSQENISTKNEFGFDSIYELALARVKKAFISYKNKGYFSNSKNSNGIKCFKVTDSKVNKVLQYNEKNQKVFSDDFIDYNLENKLSIIWELVLLENLTLATSFFELEDFFVAYDENTKKVLVLFLENIICKEQFSVFKKIEKQFLDFKVILFLKAQIEENSTLILMTKDANLTLKFI